MPEKKVKVKSKTPKLIGAALVLSVIAAGVTFSFQKESAAFRNMLKRTLKGWMSHEDVEHKRKFEEGDVSFQDRQRTDENMDLRLKHSERDSGKENDLNDLALDERDDMPVRADDEERARVFLKKAEEHIKHWRLGTALSLARKVQDLKCSRSLREKGRYLEEKVRTVKELTAGVKPDVASDLSRLKVISLANGNELKGVVERKGNGRVVVRDSDNMTYTLAQNEIINIEKVKAEDERAKIISEFDEHYSRAKSSNDPLNMFEVGILGIKKRLEDEGHRSILEAYDIALDRGGLKVIISEHRARTLLAQGIWREETGNLPIARKKYRECMTIYPDTKAAKNAKKLLDYSLAREKQILREQKIRREKSRVITAREKKAKTDRRKQPDTAARNEPERPRETGNKSGSGGSSGRTYSSKFSSSEIPKLRKADDYYYSALKHMKVAFANRPSQKSNYEFKKAEGLLRKAIAIWERVNARHNDSDLEMKLIKANEQLYSSIKLRTI